MSSSSMLMSKAGRRGGVLFKGMYFFLLFMESAPFCHRRRMPAEACARCWRKEDALRFGLDMIMLGFTTVSSRGSESAHDVPVSACLVREDAVGARYPGNLLSPPPGSDLVLRGMVAGVVLRSEQEVLVYGADIHLIL